LNERSKQIRRDVIKLSSENGGYHYGGSFSCVEILIALFDHILKQEDKFILSKGHSCWPLYVLLREKGLNPKLEGHPSRDPNNGIHSTTGSMGHGLPTAVGMAMAKKIMGYKGNIYVLMGDGECQEGTTWESMLIAVKHNLNNLIVIIDSNNIQGSGYLRDILPFNIGKTALCVGWESHFISGHETDKIISRLSGRFWSSETKPKLITADTVKGYGVSFMQDKPEWHSRWLDNNH
jgi:transketolase